MKPYEDKNWLSRNAMLLITNFMMLVVIAMVTAFFVDFQRWKDERRDMEIKMEGRVSLVEISQKLMERDQIMNEKEVSDIRSDIKEIRSEIEKLQKEFGAYRYTRRGASNDTVKETIKTKTK